MESQTPSPKEPTYTKPQGSSGEFTHQKDTIEYTSDWLILKKEEKPHAEMFYTYYKKKTDAVRPLIFIFNGGPGAASAFMHIGGVSPKRLEFGKDGELLPPPAKLIENEHSWTDFADLVFIDPVGTGWSRFISSTKTDKDKKTDSDDKNYYFQLNKDLESLGEFINQFLSVHERWSSAVYIAGESYGGFRVAKLSKLLQEKYGVGLNGSILISPCFEWNSLVRSDYDILAWINAFPSFVAVSAFHGKSKVFSKNDPLEKVLEGAEKFAVEKLLPLLAQGDLIGEEKRAQLIEQTSEYLGMKKEDIELSDGRINTYQFVRKLLGDERKLLGLYDGSQFGLDPYPDRETHQGPDPTLFAIDRVFSRGINIQLREQLGVKLDRPYTLLNMDVNTSWKVDEKRHAFNLYVGSMDDLRYAMSLNSFMKVIIVHGVYDLVTPYYCSKRLAAQMKLAPEQRKNIELKNYPGGHMFYSWEESRKSFYEDIKKLVETSSGT